MKKVYILFLMSIILLCTSCSSNKVKDERIIGTWMGSSGKYYAFREDGTAEILSPSNVKYYTAENGSLLVSYGKFGEDYYSYRFMYILNDSGEKVECLVLKHKNTEYYLTRK